MKTDLPQGTKVRIVLKQVQDGIDQSIQGREGIISSINVDGDFDYCVLIGKIKFGLKADEIEVIDE